MSAASIVAAVIAVATFRQILVLFGVLRSAIYLFPGDPQPNAELISRENQYIVIIPVLREANILIDTVAHYQAMGSAGFNNIVLVTTERERAEAAQHPEAKDTIEIARRLASSGACIHLHYPHHDGLKSDQLNFVVAHLLDLKLDAEKTFLVIYDADSRPSVESVFRFREALERYPDASVFHQSSRFELRRENANVSRNMFACLFRSVADAGALRANRFVLAYEVPRLLNRLNTFPYIRKLSFWIYSHVTGHGLCLKLSLLRDIPIPNAVPIEDMYYSFILCSRGVPMIPVRCLDQAEVPESVEIQFKQSSRWFLGPARFVSYFKHPLTKRKSRTIALGATAFAITIEWLSCAIAGPFLVVLYLYGDPFLKLLSAIFIVVHGAQVILAESAMGKGLVRERILRCIFYPFSTVLFGLAGFFGAYQLLKGTAGIGKTERG